MHTMDSLRSVYYKINKPDMSKKFLDWIETQDTKDKTVVEIGTGYSLAYWTKLFGTAIGYDHDNKWIDIASKFGTVRKFDKDIFESKRFKTDIENADYVIIDNHPMSIRREYFANYVMKNSDAIIVLDNTETNQQAYNILFSNYYMRDFPDVENTSVFFERRK